MWLRCVYHKRFIWSRLKQLGEYFYRLSRSPENILWGYYHCMLKSYHVPWCMYDSYFPKNWMAVTDSTIWSNYLSRSHLPL